MENPFEELNRRSLQGAARLDQAASAAAAALQNLCDVLELHADKLPPKAKAPILGRYAALQKTFIAMAAAAIAICETAQEGVAEFRRLHQSLE